MNNVLPDRIFIFRDGASDGQFPVIEEFEIPQIERAIKEQGPEYK